jgi:enoyl-CoA hydratase/carnithine racemase
VTSVVADERLSDTLTATIEELRSLSAAVLQLTRKTLRRLHASEFAAQLDEVERVYLSELMQTQDAQEGIRAVLEKRQPI